MKQICDVHDRTHKVAFTGATRLYRAASVGTMSSDLASWLLAHLRAEQLLDNSSD